MFRINGFSLQPLHSVPMWPQCVQSVSLRQKPKAKDLQMSHVSEENIKHGRKHKAFEFDFGFFELQKQKNFEKGIRKQGICPNTKIGLKNIYTLKGNDCHQ